MRTAIGLANRTWCFYFVAWLSYVSSEHLLGSSITYSCPKSVPCLTYFPQLAVSGDSPAVFVLCSHIHFCISKHCNGHHYYCQSVLGFLEALQLTSSGTLLHKEVGSTPHFSPVIGIQSAPQIPSGSASDRCSFSLLLSLTVGAFVPTRLVASWLSMSCLNPPLSGCYFPFVMSAQWNLDVPG